MGDKEPKKRWQGVISLLERITVLVNAGWWCCWDRRWIKGFVELIVPRDKALSEACPPELEGGWERTGIIWPFIRGIWVGSMITVFQTPLGKLIRGKDHIA